MDFQKYKSSKFAGGIQELVAKANAVRLDSSRPSDLSFAEMVNLAHPDTDMNSFYDQIGVDPNFDTITNIFTTPDSDIRWLVPEIFRDALRLGYTHAPIWPSITAIEEQVAGLSQILPSINQAVATPKRVGEGETIPLGTLSYQSKKFDIHKFGRGIKITDEVQRYVNLSVLSIYLQDFGMKMGLGVDGLALACLLNGEQADGSEAAPVIGIKTPNTLVFRDILKVWLRMAKIGRMPKIIIGGEDAALDTMELDQFLVKTLGTPMYNLNVKTPMPQGADYYIHGYIPASQQVIVDPTAALIKMNAQPMMVESERIVSNQTEAFYASFTLGFAKLFTDAALILDSSKDIAAFPFPTQMDIYGTQWENMDRK